MNICLLYASQRPDSFSNRLADIFLKALPSEPCITAVNAYELKVAPCDGCGQCKDGFVCRHRDMDEFFDKLEKCDLLVIATPVYLFGLPAPLKAIMDRFQPLYEKSLLGGNTKKKPAVLISACGRSGKASLPCLKLQVNAALEEIGFYPFGEIFVTDTDTEATIKEAMFKANSLAGAVIRVRNH